MSHMETRDTKWVLHKVDEQAPEPPNLVIAPKALFSGKTAILNFLCYSLIPQDTSRDNIMLNLIILLSTNPS